MRARVAALNGALLMIAAFFVVGCTSPSDATSSSSSSTGAANHTLSKHGVMHMSGLSTPLTYCVSCHGSDLTGGTSGVSCYKCHGKVW
jgi:hypothetical protein